MELESFEPAPPFPTRLGPHELRRFRGVRGVGDQVVELVPVAGTEQDIDVEIPLLRVHRPRHPGCTGEYSLSTEKSHSGEVKLTISGIGFGAAAKATFSKAHSYKTTGDCIEVVVPARVSMAMLSIRVAGTEVERVPSARVVHLETGQRDPRPLAPADDRCELPFEDARKLPLADTDDLRGDKDFSEDVPEELALTTSGSIGLEFSGGTEVSPVKLELGYERETTTKASITTHLEPGKRFTSYSPDSPAGMERCWTTK